MPIDYSKYPPNWKTEIRPRILKRDGDACKICKVKNYESTFRGKIDEQEVYQHADGRIYEYPSGKFIAQDICENIEPLYSENQTAIKIILTVAHLDHNIENNEDENLAALCQKCHLRLDSKQHSQTRKNKGLKNQLKLKL